MFSHYNIRTPKGKPFYINQGIKFSTNYNQSHIISIKWNFGDGSFSNKINPIHKFSTSGHKKVKCWINNVIYLHQIIKVNKPRSNIQNIVIDPNNNGINLRVINNTNDANLRIVLFQRNIAQGFEYPVTAWRVFNFSEIGKTFNFIYDPDLEMTLLNSPNNTISAKLNNILFGQKWIYTTENVLEQNGNSSSSNNFEIINQNSNSQIVKINRSTKTIDNVKLDQGQSEIFQYKPSFFIGVVSNQIKEGDVIPSNILSQINHEISILGIKSADIIATNQDQNISFTLENIKF